MIRETVSLVTDTALDRNFVLQKFGVSAAQRSASGSGRRLLQSTGATTVLIAVQGWKDGSTAQDGARLLAGAIINGAVKFQLSLRGLSSISSISYSSVQITTSAETGASPPVVPTPTEAKGVWDDPTVLGAIIAAGVVVVLTLLLLPVVAIMLRRNAEVVPAEEEAAPLPSST